VILPLGSVAVPSTPRSPRRRSTSANVVVAALASASPARVWQALVDPTEVAGWDGVEPLEVPPAYPAPGQHARWRTHLGPLSLTLHDRVRTVEPERTLASTIDVGFVHVEERYLLTAGGEGTVVVSENDVTATVPGLGWLAVALTRRSVRASMARLAVFCATSP
jgi:uncharacterized protein YndB with AHSA1/START domain